MFTLRNENADLQRTLNCEQTRGDIDCTHDLETLKQNLAVASDGIAELENFKTVCETRLQSLEQIPDDIVEDSVMETSEGRNVTIANDKVRKIQKDLSDHIASMDTFKINLNRENRRRHLEWDQQEQYSRRDCVVVKGVPCKRDENTTDIVCRIAYSMGLTICPSDISVSHRVGRQVGNTRPIICKFTRRDTKYLLMANRSAARHIKDDGEGNPVRIFIDENLTQMRARVCKKLREDKISHRVRDGKIHLTTTGENPTTETVLDSPSDWEGLNWPDSVKMDLGIYPKD